MESMIFYLWGHKASTIEKRTITFDDDECDMLPELNKEIEEESEDTRKKVHPLIAQLKDRELKWSKMEKQNRRSKR